MKTYKLEVFGKVQGVYFRQSTQQYCTQNGIVGQVCNKPDGSVEIIAKGPIESLEKLVEWAKVGPPRAVVNKTIVEEIPDQAFTRFSIVR